MPSYIVWGPTRPSYIVWGTTPCGPSIWVMIMCAPFTLCDGELLSCVLSLPRVMENIVSCGCHPLSQFYHKWFLSCTQISMFLSCKLDMISLGFSNVLSYWKTDLLFMLVSFRKLFVRCFKLRKSIFQYERTFENPREIISSLQDKNIKIHVQDKNHLIELTERVATTWSYILRHTR